MLIGISCISSAPETRYHFGYTETGRQNLAFWFVFMAREARSQAEPHSGF